MKIMIEEFYQGELEEKLGYINMTITIKILATQETAIVLRNLKVALMKLKFKICHLLKNGKLDP